MEPILSRGIEILHGVIGYYSGGATILTTAANV